MLWVCIICYVSFLDGLNVYNWASLVAQLVKNLPAMCETWVQSLGLKDPLEKERLPTSVFLPGEFPWDHKESDMTE